MPVLKGYRTLIFAAVMAVAGVLGHHLAPDLVNSWLDSIFAFAGVAIALLRVITTTPFGNAIPPEVAQVANLIAVATDKGSAALPAADPPAAADAPASGGATQTGPPADLVALAQSIAAARDTINAVHVQMAASLLAANSQISAALPAAVVQPQPDPLPQPVPQPAAVAGPTAGGVNA